MTTSSRGYWSSYSRLAISVLMLAVAACGTVGTEPAIALIGTWDLVGFTDGGAPAVTTGTWTFAMDSTFSVNGTVTFPGEPTDSLVVVGDYIQSGNAVQLTIGADSGAWILTGDNTQIVLTRTGPPPATTITLRRR